MKKSSIGKLILLLAVLGGGAALFFLLRKKKTIAETTGTDVLIGGNGALPPVATIQQDILPSGTTQKQTITGMPADIMATINSINAGNPFTVNNLYDSKMEYFSSCAALAQAWRDVFGDDVYFNAGLDSVLAEQSKNGEIFIMPSDWTMFAKIKLGEYAKTIGIPQSEIDNLFLSRKDKIETIYKGLLAKHNVIHNLI